MSKRIPHHLHCQVSSVQGPRAASEVNPIICPFCHIGHPSYFAYMDHLQNSPCGIRQQNLNQPRNPYLGNPFGPNQAIRHDWY